MGSRVDFFPDFSNLPFYLGVLLVCFMVPLILVSVNSQLLIVLDCLLYLSISWCIIWISDILFFSCDESILLDLGEIQRALINLGRLLLVYFVLNFRAKVLRMKLISQHWFHGGLIIFRRNFSIMSLAIVEVEMMLAIEFLLDFAIWDHLILSISWLLIPEFLSTFLMTWLYFFRFSFCINRCTLIANYIFIKSKLTE